MVGLFASVQRLTDLLRGQTEVVKGAVGFCVEVFAVPAELPLAGDGQHSGLGKLLHWLRDNDRD